MHTCKEHLLTGTEVWQQYLRAVLSLLCKDDASAMTQPGEDRMNSFTLVCPTFIGTTTFVKALGNRWFFSDQDCCLTLMVSGSRICNPIKMLLCANFHESSAQTPHDSYPRRLPGPSLYLPVCHPHLRSTPLSECRLPRPLLC